MSRSPRVLPFRVIPEQTIEPDPNGWYVSASGIQRAVPSGDSIREWDALLKMRLQRKFLVRKDFRHELGLNCLGSSFALVVVLTTGRGQSRRVVYRDVLPADVTGELSVSFEPKSSELAFEMEIESSILLTDNLTQGDTISAQRKASRLWSHVDKLRLEGGSAGLAMYEADLEKLRPGEGLQNARLLVDIRGEAEDSFEQAVVVWINSKRTDFRDRLDGDDPGAREDAWTLVVRQVCISALQGEWWDEGAVYIPGSLGETVGRWLRQMGNGLWSVSDLRQRTTQSPSAFDGMVNSFVAVLAEKRSGAR